MGINPMAQAPHHTPKAQCLNAPIDRRPGDLMMGEKNGLAYFW
jgi:hypothetical protein